jgi:hypothetical protein
MLDPGYTSEKIAQNKDQYRWRPEEEASGML